jgi:hypothetical protein
VNEVNLEGGQSWPQPPFQAAWSRLKAGCGQDCPPSNPVCGLPHIDGRPVRLEIRRELADRRGPVHAGAFIRERRIAFDAELAADPQEFARIFVHEVFHFAWPRLGNPRRWSYEALLREEMRDHARGELGWSAEWRKRELAARDPGSRTRRWREYVCESFCDTAAWMLSGVPRHREYTLARRFRERRRQWFQESDVTNRISI